ncbi:MAG: carbohydrate ABC transporter permease [Alphaproteobacteria bacterium]
MNAPSIYDSRIATLILAALNGALWGLVVSILVGSGLALLTGLELRPLLGPSMLAGLGAGATHALLRRDEALCWSAQSLVSALVFVVLLLAVSLGRPYAVAIGDGVVIWLIALVAATVCTQWVIMASQHPIRFGAMNRFRREQAMMLSLRAFGFVFFGAIVVLPLYVMVMTSLKTQQALLANPLNLFPSFEDGLLGPFRSYIELFQVYDFGRYIWNSALISVATVFITLLFAVPGSYAVSRLSFPGRSTLSRSILMIYLVPAIVLVIPLYAIFAKLGLRDSLWGLLVVYPATTLPVALYMLQGYFRGVPAELEEAGLMDGCSRLRVIWSITLPLSVPALASVSLYVFMIAWNEFLFAFMFLDDPKMFTLSRGVVSLDSSEVPRQHLMAGAVVSTVPIVVIFLWAERFMVQGLTSGGVKG